jgi:type IV pilus assembly protein PilB
MTNEQLLQEIQNRTLLAPDTITRVKRESFLSGKTAEAILYEKRFLDDEKIAQLKSEILKIPYKKIDFASFDDQNLSLISEETVRTYGVVPLEQKDGVLIAGMMNPDDLKSQEALKFVAHRSRLNLGIYVISYGDWQKVLKKYSPYRSEIEEAVRTLDIKSQQKDVKLEDGTEISEDAPIIRIVAGTIREAISVGASDIHIEPQDNYLRVRFRMDGQLKEVASLPVEFSNLVVSRVKVLSGLKIDETRTPQDGRFRSKVFDREIDFRVSTFPTPLGEKVAIRVLDSSTGLKSFETLGLEGKNLETVKAGVEKPYGMILVTGPTGSGKTTTLYAILQILNREDVNIVSLEDPVEYFVAGINQSQVRPEIGYDFASGLRQILRQDPDVIMVGEIRDTETAGLAINAALTGHIVLSTLHTNNSIGVIPRLIDMKVEPFLLPSGLNLMMGQRLVSKLCQECKKAEEAPAPAQAIIERDLASLPEDLKKNYKKPYSTYQSPGCPACKGKGVAGRMALFEVLHMTPELEEIINAGPTAQKILAEAKRQGMITMRQDGILKALSGLVALEEVVKETEEI